MYEQQIHSGQNNQGQQTTNKMLLIDWWMDGLIVFWFDMSDWLLDIDMDSDIWYELIWLIGFVLLFC